MTHLDTLDLCARLDGLKTLCDRLEGAQDEPATFLALIERISTETEAFRHVIVKVTPKGGSPVGA